MRTATGMTLSQLPKRLRKLEQVGPLAAFPAVPSIAGRHPIVVAFGPSVAPLIPAIQARRDRLCVITPFRTAVSLAEAGVMADVVVLSYPSPGGYPECEASWRAASSDIRRHFTTHSTLLIEPFAPPVLWKEFDSVRVFDDGGGMLGDESQLPSWGLSLIPALTYAVRLGAPAVAIAGVNLTAPKGRRLTNWLGQPVRLPMRLEVLYRLLGLLGATRTTFVDLVQEAVRKPGFVHESLDAFLSRPAAPPRARVRPVTVSAGQIADRIAGSTSNLARLVREMAEVAGRAVRLARENKPADRVALAAAVETMERHWRYDVANQAVVQLLQPTYLRALWELPIVKPLNAEVAANQKARLIGGEFLDLVGTFESVMAEIFAALARPAATAA
jgi:hypothetical protein